jgi:hypothetical protein
MNKEKIEELLKETLKEGERLSSMAIKTAEEKQFKNDDLFAFQSLALASAFAVMIKTQYMFTKDNVSLDEFKTHCMIAIDLFLSKIKVS